MIAPEILSKMTIMIQTATLHLLLYLGVISLFSQMISVGSEASYKSIF